MNRLMGSAAAVLSAFALSATAASAAPTASLSTTSGSLGTSVTVSGTGFAPSTSIDVFFDTTDVALAVSEASGAVSATIEIPATAQPGKHWITLDQLSNHTAAQALFTVTANWPQGGWSTSWREFNPFENTLNPGNVGQVTEAWSQPVTPYSNPKPFVDLSGDLFVFDEEETLHAYTPGGKLLWTAAPGTTFRFTQAAPAANNGYVYVGDANGLVTGYPYQCRTDGGVCTTQRWSANIGTPVEGGLTIRNGLIYAPGGDGLVHVLNATTGAIGKSITPYYTGALTAPVSFAADGGAYIVQGGDVSEIGPGPSGGASFASGVSLSTVAVGNGIGYATTTEGTVTQVLGGWSTPIGSSGCDVAPAFADNVVYAASCNTVGAYDAGTGATIWSVSVPTQPLGLAVANGVLYVCTGYRVHAYDASYGGSLGTEDPCDVAPEIVQGTVYSTSSELNAATLNGAMTTALRRAGTPRRPDPRRLRPNPRLHRRHGRRAPHSSG